MVCFARAVRAAQPAHRVPGRRRSTTTRTTPARSSGTSRGPGAPSTTADGVIIAQSVPSNDRFELQRQYPEGPLFAPITGYYSFTLGSAGVEKTYNDELAGRTLDLSFQDLGDLFVDKDRTGDLSLTVRADLQRIAAEQLGERQGLGRGARPAHRRHPRDGVVPDLRPEPPRQPRHPGRAPTSATAARRVARQAAAVACLPGPLLPGLHVQGRHRHRRAHQRRHHRRRARRTPCSAGLHAAGTNRPLQNFGGSSCGGTLFEVLRVSCNSAFAQMGVDTGPEAMIDDRRAVRVQQGRPDRPDRPGALELPRRLRAQRARARPVRHRPERREAPPRCRWRWSRRRVANDGVIMVPARARATSATPTATSSTPTSPRRGRPPWTAARRP